MTSCSPGARETGVVVAFDYLLVKNNDSSLPPRLLNISEIAGAHAVCQQHLQITLKSGELINLQGIAANAAFDALSHHRIAVAGDQCFRSLPSPKSSPDVGSFRFWSKLVKREETSFGPIPEIRKL